MMGISFVEGFLLGLGAAVPLGPINILLMNRALTSYSHAVATGFGAMSADGLYLALILFGMATFMTSPILLQLLSLLGALFLLYLAYVIFKHRDRQSVTTNRDKTLQKLPTVYLQGFLLTFVNPYTVAFWLSVGGYVSSRGLEPVMTLIGMFTAIMMWVTLMPYLVHRSRHRISQRVTVVLNSVGSLVLAGFGLVLLSELV